MKLWRVYRLDNENDYYHVWALVPWAAIRSAQLEHFGVVLRASALGASR